MSEAAEMLTRHAPNARADKLDLEARTVEVVWAAGARVRRRAYDGPYMEELSMDPKHIRLDRLNAGASVLDAHSAWSMKDRVGTVVPGSARVERGRGIATIKLSSNELGETLLRDLEAGHRLQISVGYQIHRSERLEGEDDELPIVRAIDWEPLELSAVPVPADPRAHTRAAERAMPKTAPIVEDDEESTFVPSERALGIAARRELAVRMFGEDDAAEYADDLERVVKATRGKAAKDVRAALLDLKVDIQERNPTFSHISPDHNSRTLDNPEFRIRAIGEALAHRVAPSGELSEPAREFVYLTIPELARRCLERAGQRTTAMSQATLVRMGLNTTSDFPLILADTVNRRLRAAYTAAPSAIKQLAHKSTARDFRDKHSLTMSEAGALKKVNEHGEYTSSTFEESGEKYCLATYGRIFGITRQALVNDDLGAFDTVPTKLGRAADAFEAKFLADLIASNPKMSDGKALFHADHKNLVSSGTALSIISLNIARTSMRRQVGLTGELISVTPKFLLVAPELEAEAEKILADIAAATVNDVNPFSKKLTLVVEPRLTSQWTWYVSAAPSEIDGLEYAYLEGEEGPQIDHEEGFEIDGMRFKVRLDYGAAFLDWRGWYKNVGAQPS
jgi:hypothetical protein